jgi:signal transduction histidine kinase
VQAALVPYRSALAAAAVSGVVLVAAVVADLHAPHASVGATVVDIGVGLVVVASALAAAGPVSERLLVAAVGVAWLAGSALPVARSWHQAALFLAVAFFPVGRLRSRRDAGPVVLSLVTASGVLSQLGMAGAFLLSAALAGTDRRNPRPVRGWPVLAAGGVAATLGAVWTIGRLQRSPIEPAIVLSIYESVLVLIALSFPVATRAAARTHARIAEGMVGAGQLTGLEGLASELRRAASDPDLEIYPWSPTRCAFVGETGAPVEVDDHPGSWLDVLDGEQPIAGVSYGGTALDEPMTAAAVCSAVRMTLTHQRLQDEQRGRLGQLRDARTRLLAATDRTREQLATELDTVVQAPIDAALRHIGATMAGPGARGLESTVSEAIGVVLAQLSTAAQEIGDLTTGVPPRLLGDGRLHDALSALAEASPVPVSLYLAADARAGRLAETTLFYVCSEGLANAAKHAGATSVSVSLRRAASGIELVVADDGRGGADTTGSGLAGLGDRVSAHGGRLRVKSPPGAGTVISATLPLTVTRST